MTFNKLSWVLTLAISFIYIGCDKENPDNDTDDHTHTDDEHAYHAHILSPTAMVFHMGDTVDIEIEFEDHNGGTVHNISVMIMDTTTDSVVYSMPHHSHIHATSGSYEFNGSIVLDSTTGFYAHSNWKLIAEVWGHTAGEGLETETHLFHVHP